MEVLSPGAIIDAVVERIEPYGAWIDHEGRRGLVGIPEVSWSRIGHPGEALSVGQRIRVKVLAVAEGQFSASIRAARPELDPWRDPAEFSKGTAFVAPLSYGRRCGVCCLGRNLRTGSAWATGSGSRSNRPM
jgi:ribosomal protein S1